MSGGSGALPADIEHTSPTARSSGTPPPNCPPLLQAELAETLRWEVASLRRRLVAVEARPSESAPVANNDASRYPSAGIFSSPPLPPPLVLQFASCWRYLFFLGALCPTGCALVSLMTANTKLAVSSFLLYVLSYISATAFAIARPRQILSEESKARRVEKVLIVCSQVMFSLVPLFSGATLIRSDPFFDHPGTTFTGWGCLLTGICAMISSPVMMIRYVETIATLNDPHLSKFMEVIAGSLPKALTSSLYISFDAIKCVVKADGASPVLVQCGNPVLPSFCINSFIVIFWIVVGLVEPLSWFLPSSAMTTTIGLKSITLADVVSLRLTSGQGTKLAGLSVLAATTVVLYSLLEEDGEDVTALLLAVTAIYILSWVATSSMFIGDMTRALKREGGSGSVGGGAAENHPSLSDKISAYGFI